MDVPAYHFEHLAAPATDSEPQFVDYDTEMSTNRC